MKKIIAFILICIMTLATLVSCGNSTDTTPEASTAGATEAEVTLLGISTDFTPTVAANVVTVPRLLSDGNSDTTTTGATNDNIIDDVYSTFTVIYRTQTVIYFTINLSNPNNRYIMDFKLSCAEDDGVTVRQGNHESRINDPNTYIRWDEAYDRIGNHQATFVLTLPNTEISPTSIRISEMYYSDRTDGTNKTTVNMNNRDVYTVYKTDSLVETVDRRNSLEYFEFGLNVNESATVKSVTVDGVEQVPNGEGKYQIPSGKLVIDYEFVTSDGRTYVGSYEEDIEVLSFRHNGDNVKVEYADSRFTLHYIITGTDFIKSDEEGVNITILNQNTRFAHLEDTCIGIGVPFGITVNDYKPGLTIIICGTEFVVADTFE